MKATARHLPLSRRPRFWPIRVPGYRCEAGTKAGLCLKPATHYDLGTRTCYCAKHADAIPMGAER